MGIIYVTNAANDSLHHLASCFYDTFCFDPDGVYKMQIAYGYEGASVGKIYQRSCVRGTWSYWNLHWNFGCSTPADLASLLGDQYPNTGTRYDLPIGGHVEIDKGLGLYLIRMSRNGVSSIIMNTFNNILQVTFDGTNPNSTYISFEKVSSSGGMNFYINEIANEQTAANRIIFVRKVF